jgi:hypothetical protein
MANTTASPQSDTATSANTRMSRIEFLGGRPDALLGFGFCVAMAC